MPTSKKGKAQRPIFPDWPLSVYGWMFGMTMAGYLAGEFFLSQKPHRTHWVA